jgi:CubicO group peptidase (beta-lactamase class C family)
VKMMGENKIGSIFVELQPDADKLRTKPFPLGAGHDKFGLGFQIASSDPLYSKFRSPGSMSWAGIYNTEFWIDPVKHIGGVQMMLYHSMTKVPSGRCATSRNWYTRIFGSSHATSRYLSGNPTNEVFL